MDLRRRRQQAGGPRVRPAAQTYTVNPLDEYDVVAGRQLSYDPNGNLLRDGLRLYRYDVGNRLVRAIDAVSGAETVGFFHDARGRRILEIVDGEATQLVYDEIKPIAEYRNGGVFAQYVYGEMDSPLHIAAETSESWYHSDLIGSVRALTDSVGSVSATYRYSPFGRSTLNGPYNPWRFAGKRLDATLGSYDFLTREYSPRLGRFFQRDTIDALGANEYTYAGNNPLTFIDPLGTTRQSVLTQRPTEEEAGAGGGTVRESVEQNAEEATFLRALSTLRSTWLENLVNDPALSPEQRIIIAPGLTDETRQVLLRDARAQKNMFPAANLIDRLGADYFHGADIIATAALWIVSSWAEGEAIGPLMKAAGRLVSRLLGLQVLPDSRTASLPARCKPWPRRGAQREPPAKFL